MANIPLVTIAPPANATEGNSGTKIFRFVVSRTAPTTGTSTCVWTLTGDMDATDLAAGQPTTGAVTFGPGVSTQNIDIVVRGDTAVEPDAQLIITLTGPVDCVLLVQPAGGTITQVTDAWAVTYAPRTGFTGSDTFEYTVRDAPNASRTGFITVTVTT